LSVLFPEEAPSPPPTSQKAQTSSDEAFERNDIREHILTTLEALREGNPVALTGMPGAGKTVITNEVIAKLRERKPEFRIIKIELAPRLDFEVFCNDLLAALERRDLFEL